MTTKKGLELAFKLRLTKLSELDTAQALCTLGARHNTLMTDACNRHVPHLDKRRDRLRGRIAQLIAELPGVTGAIYSGDPRGCTVKLTLADGRTDDWGKEGICVPGA